MPNNLVPAVERAFRIMELVANSRAGCSLSEVSRKLDMPRSSAHLILQSLETMGYLKKDAAKGRYRFGVKLVTLSRAALDNLDLREIARPLMQKLSNETGLSVHMAVLERGEAVIIEKIQSVAGPRLTTWVGRRLDVNCTGVGKALIAFLPETVFDQHIKPENLVRHNEQSIVSLCALKRRLAEVRELGYAFDDEEDEIGMRCVGAPIFDGNRWPIAAISVSGTLTAIPLERVAVLGKKVTEAANTISSAVGFSSTNLLIKLAGKPTESEHPQNFSELRRDSSVYPYSQ